MSPLRSPGPFSRVAPAFQAVPNARRRVPLRVKLEYADRAEGVGGEPAARRAAVRVPVRVAADSEQTSGGRDARWVKTWRIWPARRRGRATLPTLAHAARLPSPAASGSSLPISSVFRSHFRYVSPLPPHYHHSPPPSTHYSAGDSDERLAALGRNRRARLSRPSRGRATTGQRAAAVARGPRARANGRRAPSTRPD